MQFLNKLSMITILYCLLILSQSVHSLNNKTKISIPNNKSLKSTDYLNDDKNCGGCGIECPVNSQCVSGKCECKETYTKCGTKCLDLSEDNDNCGVCSNSCHKDLEKCQKGKCECIEGYLKCNNTCTKVMTDTENCTACGTSCGNDQICSDCKSKNITLCNNVSTNIFTDYKNCGGCGKSCGENEKCTDGKCQCIDSFTSCQEIALI